MHVHTVVLCSCCSDHRPIGFRFIPHLFCFTESQGNWPLQFTRFPGHLTQSLWGLWVLMWTKFCLSPPSISGRYGV